MVGLPEAFISDSQIINQFADFGGLTGAKQIFRSS